MEAGAGGGKSEGEEKASEGLRMMELGHRKEIFVKKSGG